jgi:hypothetical protein
MRRLCLILLCGLIAVPAAVAATRAIGDGTLELQNASGKFSITGTRGTLWGQMESGSVVATDPVAGDGTILISGAESMVPLANNARLYKGTDIHFRVTGGRYKLWLRGSGVDLTAVGVGTAVVTAAVDDDPGKYAIDSGKWVTVPASPRALAFGDQSTPTP